MNTKNLSPLKHLKKDIPASIVVFLVSLPLCLGIAEVSGAPSLAGIIAGVLGGIVVGSISKSPLGVSGPAAGLAIIVANSITDLGGFENFIVAIILAGVLQVIMGFAKAGIIAYYLPTSVIHGMLAGIGLKIFIKQIPKAFGYNKDPDFFKLNGKSDLDVFYNLGDYINPTIIIITSVCLSILLLWQTNYISKQKFSRIIPGPFLAVLTGIGLNIYFSSNPETEIQNEHLVNLPVFQNLADIRGSFIFPNFAILANPKIYLTAIIITAVASIETLLCVEASDKQDIFKRVTPTNRELKAQGIGNIISGFIGGLPITQVIVRSSANQQSGGITKASTILHGVFILISVLAIPAILNLIPLGTLAAILLVVGYKLASPKLFKKIYREGMEQFLPFIVTVVVMMISDLLIGVGSGLVVAIFIILKNNFSIAHQVITDNTSEKRTTTIQLSENVTFLHKASLVKTLEKIPNSSIVIIDSSATSFIHHDVLEIFEDFKINAYNRGIQLSFIDLNEQKQKRPLKHIKIINNS